MRQFLTRILGTALLLPLSSLAQTVPSAVNPSSPSSGALIVPEEVSRPSARPAESARTAPSGKMPDEGRAGQVRFREDLEKCREQASLDARQSCTREAHAARAQGLYRD